MKKVLYIAFLLLMTASLAAQDLQILSQNDLVGTARYVGMAGAMTAVGGDPSAVKDNPAALGVYRRLEVTLTLDEVMDRVHQYGRPEKDWQTNTFTAAQAAFVYSYVNPASDIVANNFIISYHRLANFNRQYTAVCYDDLVSLADVAALKTLGLSESALQPESRWDDPNVGWLSCQAYDTYLINPDPMEKGNWYSVLPPEQTINTYFTMKESGYVNQYSLGWGANFRDRLYWGITLNVLSLYHNQTAQYFESFGDSCSLSNDTYVSHNGVGVNAALGIIAHPVRWLRLGASFTTPSATSVTTTNYGDMISTLYAVDSLGVTRLMAFGSKSPTHRVTDRSFVMPLRTSLGIAFQLKNFGLLSFQYDYSHRKSISDTHMFRAGLEGVIVNSFFLNAGYAYESTFTSSSPEMLAVNTIRTDAYTQRKHHSHYITAGFGYRASHVFVHAAYRLRMQQFDTFAHELATPYDMRAMTHDLVITIGFHTK